jgi:hypothetical protein
MSSRSAAALSWESFGDGGRADALVSQLLLEGRQVVLAGEDLQVGDELGTIRVPRSAFRVHQEPVPGEHAFAAGDDSVGIRGDGVEEGFLDQGLTSGIADVEEECSGV